MYRCDQRHRPDTVRGAGARGAAERHGAGSLRPRSPEKTPDSCHQELRVQSGADCGKRTADLLLSAEGARSAASVNTETAARESAVVGALTLGEEACHWDTLSLPNTG